VHELHRDEHPGVVMRSKVVLAGLAIAAVAAGFEFYGLFPGGLDHPAIEYATRPAHNVVSELNRKIQQGEIRLTFNGPSGYLRSTLQALNIPVESQMVVFSKTSLQQPLINPLNPRSIFFNDSVAAAWVHGEPFVELAVEDPRQGVIFYTLDQKPRDKPLFARQDSCLQCHESYSSVGVPGMLVRSVFPAADGTAMHQLGDYISDHRSPFEERWGGWYVTGKTGGIRHMGNLIFNNAGGIEPLNTAADIDSLDGKFDTGPYLSPYSDVVALMIFDHQMHMMNLFTRAGWEVRWALYEHRADTDRIIRDAANDLVDYLLFADETPLRGRIEGTSGFREKFAAEAPRDSHGRSLRQFDLETRLMRYRCSYMIYSTGFDGLPAELKDAVYQRMWRILSGQETSAKYAPWPFAARQAIIEILRETKTGLPDYFRAL